MGNPINRIEKKQRSFDDRKNKRKNMGQTAQFFHQKINGKRGFKCLSLSGRSFCVCPRADALFDLGFEVWILDLFFFAFWDVMGKPWTAQKKINR